jgi:hypothetical protein
MSQYEDEGMSEYGGDGMSWPTSSKLETTLPFQQKQRTTKMSCSTSYSVRNASS